MTPAERAVAEAMPRVIGLLRAVSRRDWPMMARVVRSTAWNDASCEAMRCWVSDMVTGRGWYAARYEGLRDLEEVRSIATAELLAADRQLSRPLPADLRICLAVHALIGS